MTPADLKEAHRLFSQKGGLASLKTMTPEARHERAVRAVRAREQKRAARRTPFSVAI